MAKSESREETRDFVEEIWTAQSGSYFKEN